MTRAELKAAITRLERRQAAQLALPVLDPTASAARATALLKIADPSPPMTAENRRACRVAELLQIARQRAARSSVPVLVMEVAPATGPAGVPA
jgi:hypothetical protein